MWVQMSAILLSPFLQQDPGWLEERNKTLLLAMYGEEEDMEVASRSVHAELKRLQGSGAVGKSSRHLRAVSSGWFLLGNYSVSEKYAQKWKKADPDSGPCCLLLAKIHLFKAKEAEIRIDRMRRPDLAAKWRGEALALLDRKMVWDPKRPMDLVLAEALQLFAKGAGEDAGKTCREAVEKWGTERGVEEFWLVLGWLSRGEERIRACDEALKIRPGFGRALFLRGCGKIFKGDKKGAVEDFGESLKSQPLMEFSKRYRDIEAVRGSAPLVSTPRKSLDYDPKRFKTRKIHTSASREVWLMDPDEIKWAMKNFESEMKRNISVVSSGNGLRIKSIKSGSIGFSRGLKVNDVIRSINGHSMKSVEDIRKMQKDPRNSRRRSMTVVIQRTGRNMVLEYRSMPVNSDR